MKRSLSIALLLALLLTLCACGSQAQTGSAGKEAAASFTIRQLIDTKEWPEGAELTVTLTDIVNPVLAVVEDETGSINLFGVMIDGEFRSFEEAGLAITDTIALKDGQYNELEGSAEIAEATLAAVR